jgi:threonine dehydrogenase-like Zn-dependent dehydrogenase
VRFEEREDPTIIEPTDAIIKISATCVCGSDLWPYRAMDERRAIKALLRP